MTRAEPEWLDLPAQGFVIEGDLPDERPVIRELDPKWHLLACWQLEREDVGRELFADLEIKQPANFVARFSPLPDGEEFMVVDECSPTRITLHSVLDEIGYAIAGVYTCRVEWTGSVATRDIGEFAPHIAHSGG